MKKTCWFLGLCLVLTFSARFGWGQNIFPYQKDLTVTITPNVVKTSAGRFDYLYTVFNHRDSRQTIDDIILENKAPVSNIKSPQKWPRGGSYAIDNESKVNTRPFVFFSPAIFHSDLGISGHSNEAPVDSVDPGEVSEEFGMLDHAGPPTIVEWKVMGWAPIPEYDESRDVIIGADGTEYPVEDWGDTVMDYPETLPNTNPADNAARGKTIGPSTPPVNSEDVCDTFLLKLIDQVREAVSLGWIKHDLRTDREQGIGKNWAIWSLIH